MPFVTRPLLLQTLAKHGPLTAQELASGEVLGLCPDAFQLSFLLRQLVMAERIVAIKGRSLARYALAEPGPAA